MEHGHDSQEVEVLVVFADDDTDRTLLPKKIIVVDPEDFVLKTHEMRKAYAIGEQAKAEVAPARSAFGCLQSAIVGLLSAILCETPQEGTPEREACVSQLGGERGILEKVTGLAEEGHMRGTGPATDPRSPSSPVCRPRSFGRQPMDKAQRTA